MMIPRLKADLRLSDLKALWPASNGESDVLRFEDAFADLAGQKHAIAFPYGRTAQIATLKALGKPGGEVICPSYTCVVVPHAIVKAGMKPVFVDSEEAAFNMDWEFVQDATNSETAAVIATSIFGHPVNGKAFDNYRSNNPDMAIFQDCAHSFFAGLSHRDGLAAFYGLNVSKIITSLFGGMVTTDDDVFAGKIREIRSNMLASGGLVHEIRRSLYLTAIIPAFSSSIYGVVNKLERMGLLNHFVKYYDPSVIDLPADAFVKMGGIEARIGTAQCFRYQDIVAHRKMLAAFYREQLTGIGDLKMPPFDDEETVSHFVVRTSQAKGIIQASLSEGIQLGELIDYDCATMPCYRNARYVGNNRSQDYPPMVINLPVHKNVSLADAKRVVDVIGKQF